MIIGIGQSACIFQRLFCFFDMLMPLGKLVQYFLGIAFNLKFPVPVVDNAIAKLLQAISFFAFVDGVEVTLIGYDPGIVQCAITIAVISFHNVEDNIMVVRLRIILPAGGVLESGN